MTRKCCVLGCKSNYESVSAKGQLLVTTFAFPKDEERKKEWVRVIRRQNWQPSKHSSVCIKHFDESDVVLDQIYKNGSTITMLLLRSPQLKEHAVPTIFPDLPVYLASTFTANTGKGRQIRWKTVQPKEAKKTDKFSQAQFVKHFEDFVKTFQTKMNDKYVETKWNFQIKSGVGVWLYLLTIECSSSCCESEIELTAPKNECSVFVKSDLTLKLFVGKEAISAQDLNWVLPRDLKLSRWSQLENILVSLLEMKLQRDEAIEQFLKNDIILSYENFLKDFQNPEKNLLLWNFKISEGRVWFYRLSIDVEAAITASHELKIVTSVSVSNQLTVSIYHKGIKISPKDLKWLFPCGLKLTRWSQLERLFTHYKDIKGSTTTTEISSNNRKRKSSKASKAQTRRCPREKDLEFVETTEKVNFNKTSKVPIRRRASEKRLKLTETIDCEKGLINKASKAQRRRRAREKDLKLTETALPEKVRITEACKAQRRRRAHERNLKHVKAIDCVLPEEVLFIDFENLPKENLENLLMERDSTSINKINLDCQDDFNSLEIKLEQDELVIKDEPEEVIGKYNSPMNMHDAEFSTFCTKDVAAGTEIKVDPCAAQEPSASDFYQDKFKCRICRQCGFVNVFSDGIGNDTFIDKVKKPFKCQRCHKKVHVNSRIDF